jgi:hypothetical protein
MGWAIMLNEATSTCKSNNVCFLFDNNVNRNNVGFNVDLPPVINFINFLREALTRVDPKSAKMTVESLVILRFWDLHA